jgi:hypothetical protein
VANGRVNRCRQSALAIFFFSLLFSLLDILNYTLKQNSCWDFLQQRLFPFTSSADPLEQLIRLSHLYTNHLPQSARHGGARRRRLSNQSWELWQAHLADSGANCPLLFFLWSLSDQLVANQKTLDLKSS